MIQTHISKVTLALIIIALQSLVLNHIHIYGYATPIICVYFLLTLPLNTGMVSKLLWAFCLGMVQDALANTPGAMAATMTLMAMLHSPLLIVIGGQDKLDKDEDTVPSIKSLGQFPFLRYTAVALLIQNTVFYLLMTFNFASFTDTAINILGSTVLSFFIIWFIEKIRCNTIR